MSDRRDEQLLVAELLRRAEDDVLNLKFHVNQRGGTPALACFLAEQVAEKYLKALLLSRQGDYPRTHDLNQLLTLLKPFVPDIVDELGDAVVLLSPYYIGTRYPADIPLESFSWREADSAQVAAMRVKSFVINLLNQQYMFRYGRASYSMEFSHYAEVPKNVAENIIGEKGK